MGSKKQLNRDQEIIALLKLGKFSLEEIGLEYGLTRERVRQIWKKAMGVGYRIRILRNRESIREREIAGQDDILFICECGAEVSRREGKHKHKYCLKCHWISQKEHRDPKINKTCLTCGKIFHPFRNRTSQSQIARGVGGGKYCSVPCFLKKFNKRQ